MEKKNIPRERNAKIKIQYPEQWIEPDKIIEMANKLLDWQPKDNSETTTNRVEK